MSDFPVPTTVRTPLSTDSITNLRAGDQVLLSGVIYTARDAAHARMVQALREGLPLPVPIADQVIYYSGPAPARPGKMIGPAGPTTSGRMDAFTPQLLAAGLKGMIGKGSRSKPIRDALAQFLAVYFVAVGGAAALLSEHIMKMELVAYEDLESEAIYRLDVLDFPLLVANDIYGGDLYGDGAAAYRIQEMS